MKLHVRLNQQGRPEVVHEVADDDQAPDGWQSMTLEEYAAELAAHPEPADPAPALDVPGEVAAWRLEAVAELAGLTSQIDAAIAALPEPTKTVVTKVWTRGTVVERGSATVAALASELGLSSAQVDDLFRQAAAISV